MLVGCNGYKELLWSCCCCYCYNHYILFACGYLTMLTVSQIKQYQMIGWVMNKWTGKDVERSGHGLVQGTNLAFAWRD